MQRRGRTSCDYLPFTKKSKCNPYLKILDFSQLFVADATMKKIVLPPVGRLFLVGKIAHALEDSECCDVGALEKISSIILSMCSFFITHEGHP